MTAYNLHLDGNCNPDTCPMCANECSGCSNWLTSCTCPQLPIDTEDTE